MYEYSRMFPNVPKSKVATSLPPSELASDAHEAVGEVHSSSRTSCSWVVWTGGGECVRGGVSIMTIRSSETVSDRPSWSIVKYFSALVMTL